MLIVISYDIEDDNTRNKLAKKLKDYGPGVQKSVFEADVSPKEINELKNLLQKVKLKKNDSIRFYQICESCQQKVCIWGKGEVTQDREYYIQ